MSKIARGAAEEIAEAILDNPGAHIGRAAWVGQFRVITDRHMAPTLAMMERLACLVNDAVANGGEMDVAAGAVAYTDYEAFLKDSP